MKSRGNRVGNGLNLAVFVFHLFISTKIESVSFLILHRYVLVSVTVWLLLLSILGMV